MTAIRKSGYDAMVVQHREGNTHGIPAMLYDNMGLEFGAYRKYVEHHWDGSSDVLFIHDDMEILDQSGLRSIETLGGLGVDQAYIFPDEIHEMVNGGAHGRAIWMSGQIIQKLAGDFPADMSNAGVHIGVVAQLGILKFHEAVMRVSRNAGVIAIVPQLRFGHRGRIHEQMFVYRKAGSIPGGLVHVSE